MPSPISEDQIRAVYRGTIDALYGAVSRKCGGDRDLAEDVVQETWLRAIRDWKVNGLPRSPIAWLLKVSRNLLLNEFRRRAVVPLDALAPDEITESQEDDGAFDPEEAQTAVNRAMSLLPPDQSRLLKTFYLEQRKVSHIAEGLGVSERTVEGRLRRAREKLRNALGMVIK